MKTNKIARALIVGGFLCLAGCDQQQKAALEKNAEQAIGVVQDAAGKTTQQVVKDGGSAVSKTWQQSVKNLQQGGVVLRVKSVLALSSRLEGANIDVELQGNKIVLRGETLSSKQRKIASALAEGVADPKFKVVNRLKVSGPGNAKMDASLKAKINRGY